MKRGKWLSGYLKRVTEIVNQASAPGSALLYKRPMRMCRWMGSHFHDWIDYIGVAFSVELLEWVENFLIFLGKKVLHIYG